MALQPFKKMLDLARSQKSDSSSRSPPQIICSEENDKQYNNKFPDLSLEQPKHNYSQSIPQGVNQIMIWEGYHEGFDKTIYYVPAYLKVEVNRVNNMDYMGCSAQIDMTIYLWIMMSQLPQFIQQKILNDGEMKINGYQHIPLKDIIVRKNNKLKSENQSKHVQQFYTRETMVMELESDNFYAPFQLVNIQGKLELRQIEYFDDQTRKQVEIGFNFMQTTPFLHFKFNELRNLGNYQLAESRVAIKFSNEECFGKMKFFIDKTGELVQEIILPTFLKKNNQVADYQSTQSLLDPPNQYKNATIVISLYKYPISTIFTIFVPFYLLSLLCIGVFFTVNAMGLRSLSIFLLLMTYMGMVPAIRRTLPPTPFLIMIEILIYLQSICIILIFGQSIKIRNIKDYVFVWSQDNYFLIVSCFTLLNFIFVIGLCITHKLIWEPSYNRLSDDTKKSIEKKFNTDQWYSDSCQLLFNKYINEKLINFPYNMKQAGTVEKRKVTRRVSFGMKKK